VLESESSSTELRAKTTLELRPGQTISVQTPGGGGYGDPRRREPAAVLRDVREGKISPERARDVYRVALTLDLLSVHEAATARLRETRA
jgi:N-methylhydantoinase B